MIASAASFQALWCNFDESIQFVVDRAAVTANEGFQRSYLSLEVLNDRMLVFFDTISDGIDIDL